jgi:hypothetical protein
MIMSSERPSTQYYERRKKSRCDVDIGERGLSNPPPLRASKRTVHRDLPRGRMHIDIEIEEKQEHIVSSSEDDDVEDETYQISPRAARGVAFDDDEIMEEDDDDEEEEDPIRQVEEEEEEGAEGIKNPQQRGRIPFPPKPTIRKHHKPLSYNVVCYRGKGTTKEVKRLHNIDPRPQLKGASDYRFHTHF